MVTLAVYIIYLMSFKLGFDLAELKLKKCNLSRGSNAALFLSSLETQAAGGSV